MYMLCIYHTYVVYIPCIYCLKYFEPSPVPTLYVGRVEDLLGRVPLISCFLEGNATSTILHKYSSRQRDAFECGCADGAGPNSRRGSHVYEINTWLWNFGRPQPRVGGLSVAKTEKIRRKSLSEASKRGWATKKARTWLSHGICLVYTWYIQVYTWYILSWSKTWFLGTNAFMPWNAMLHICICTSSNIHCSFESWRNLNITKQSICTGYLMYIPSICHVYTMNLHCLDLKE